jgi:hypothetical protein
MAGFSLSDTASLLLLVLVDDGCCSACAFGATAPVHDLSLVDLESRGVAGLQAGHLADRTVDVDRAATDTADQVMVVVTDASFVARR